DNGMAGCSFEYAVDCIDLGRYKMTQKNFQEPLAKVKGLGASRDGVHHWIYQRISAIALIFLSVWMVYNLSHHVADDFESITAWLSSPWNAAGLFLFVTAATYHA